MFVEIFMECAVKERLKPLLLKLHSTAVSWLSLVVPHNLQIHSHWLVQPLFSFTGHKRIFVFTKVSDKKGKERGWNDETWDCGWCKLFNVATNASWIHAWPDYPELPVSGGISYTDTHMINVSALRMLGKASPHAFRTNEYPYSSSDWLLNFCQDGWI